METTTMTIMKKLFIFLALFPLSLHAETVNLKKNSIVCESESSIKLLKEDYLANLPGDVVLKRVKANQDGYILLAKSDKIFKDSAIKEESIWAKSRAPHSGPATAVAVAKGTDAAKNEESHTEESKKFSEFLAQCTATGESQPADIIEEKPISKIVKIKTLISGKQYDLWTSNYYLDR